MVLKGGGEGGDNWEEGAREDVGGGGVLRIRKRRWIDAYEEKMSGRKYFNTGSSVEGIKD